MSTPSPSPAGEEMRGRQIGAYRVESLLGQGGMGEVFLAWDERLSRHVAIKRIRADKELDEGRRARLRREARAVAQLSHPSIVQVFDVFETEEGEHVVMEYVPGESLDQLIARGRSSSSRPCAWRARWPRASPPLTPKA